MNVSIANDISPYFERLYSVNVRLIKLCGLDIMSSYEKHEEIILDIIHDLPRIFPCKYNKDENILELDYKGGLLEYGNEIVYLKEELEDILSSNYNFLNEVRIIRNKYEHKMHGVKIVSEGTSSVDMFDFQFKYEYEGEAKKVSLHAVDFIKLISKLNKTYSKIQNEVSQCAIENCKTEYPYYNRLKRFDFLDFVKIYEDSNIRLIGKLMHEF